MTPSNPSALFLPNNNEARNAKNVVVLAITPEEERLFFPAGVGAKPGASIVVERPRKRSPLQWTERLGELGAGVLVTAWKTESLTGFLEADRPCGLSYVCHLAGSVRRIVPRRLLENGLLVSNWGGVVAPMVAEHALLLLLACLRNLPAWVGREGSGERKSLATLDTRTLFGRRVGLHGFGGIARALVELLRPFRVDIMAHSIGVPARMMEDLGVRPASSLKELAAHAEVFVECEALTEHNRKSISAEILLLLPQGGVFINVGRGAVVDEEALFALSSSGRLRVGLDVLTEEPLSPDSPWRKNTQALLSPHIAGPTQDRYAQLGDFGWSNVCRHLDGKPVEARITLGDYDRST